MNNPINSPPPDAKHPVAAVAGRVEPLAWDRFNALWSSDRRDLAWDCLFVAEILDTKL